MTNPYADLEIRILNQTAAGYPLELTLNAEQEFSGGQLDPAFLPWIPSVDPAADGQRLFEWLFGHAKMQAAWAEVRGQFSQRRLRLRIDADAPELHALPWELLREAVEGAPPNDLAATSATPFSRYLAGRWQPGSPILQRPIRVLVAMANPQNLAQYNLQAVKIDEEWTALQNALTGLDVELIQLPQPCTLAAMESALKKGVHVLHFIGHGVYRPQQQDAALYLADDANNVKPVVDADIAAMLARLLADADAHNDDKLRLVYLSSCQTAERSPADAFRGLAPRLVQAGVPAVLAMQELVPVETARAFSTTFYRQLLQHGQVDLAANEARSHVLTAKLPGASNPVLFMRLRDGALLGQRGRIAGDKSENFWPFLLDDLRKGKCVPFLGPRVNAGLLPDAAQVAARLADKYNYPLTDRSDLAKVARYIALNAPQDLRDEYTRLLRRSLFAYLGLKPTAEDRKRFADANLTQTAAGIGWAEKVRALHENEIHHLLAELKLPLYLTTNCDSFMTEALRATGVTTVRRAGPRWEQVQAGTPQYTLDPEPSRDNPVVFHLNGYDDDPVQAGKMVLSEDDYLSHFVRLNRDHNYILPMDVVGRLGESSFLFLGYSLEDWEFRVVLQGLVAALNRPKKVNVGVQLEEAPGQDSEKVIQYLDDYMDQYNIKIYWGTPQQFATELHSEWQRLGGANGAVAEEEWDDDNW
ncbi:MAG: CHAT domain-containing protein [Caldilineaceae bacterium]